MIIFKYIFIFNILFVGGFGLLINYFESYLPAFISRSYRYGKFSSSKMSKAAELEVPKRWFKHLYVFASIYATFMIFIAICKYYLLWDYPEIIYSLFDKLCGDSKPSLVPFENALLSLILMAIHSWKRLYECHYVNVFSDKNINLMHYIVGHVHYFGTITILFAEGHGSIYDGELHWNKLACKDIMFALIFLLADYLQLNSNNILASLRKNDKNIVVYQGYKIPNGGLFNYISAPLQLTEIIMYFSLSMIIWQAETYHYITVWVIINQLECAVLTHQWNQETFKNYPKNRKILIPFIF